MCKCIDEVNVRLEEYNTRLVIPLVFSISGSPKMVIVATEKIETKKRGKPMRLYATYCPFCGSPYPKGEKHG